MHRPRAAVVVLLLLAIACSDVLAPDERQPVAEVQVAPTKLSLAPGAKATVAVDVMGPDGAVLAGRRVFWASEDTTVATVNEDGLVSARKVGTVAIAATVEGKSALVEVSVQQAPKPVATVRITPATATLTTGSKVQLSAATLDASGSQLGRPVTWGSSDTKVATVSVTGRVTAIAPGLATITATSEGRTGAASVSVAAPKPVGAQLVTVDPPSATIEIGQTRAFTATPRDGSGAPMSGRTVTWKSSNTAVATVSGSGVVTAVARGTASVTATADGKSGSATVTVVLPAVESVSVSPNVVILEKKKQRDLVATVRLANGETSRDWEVTWESSKPEIATVDGNGKVRAVKVGTATITASAGGQRGTAVVFVRDD